MKVIQKNQPKGKKFLSEKGKLKIQNERCEIMTLIISLTFQIYLDFRRGLVGHVALLHHVGLVSHCFHEFLSLRKHQDYREAPAVFDAGKFRSRADHSFPNSFPAVSQQREKHVSMSMSQNDYYKVSVNKKPYVDKSWKWDQWELRYLRLKFGWETKFF